MEEDRSDGGRALDRILELFGRLHTKDAYEGTGIGLVVIRKIIERHEGRVWVESRPGEGTAFPSCSLRREVPMRTD